MTIETVHPNIAKYLAELEAEFKKYEDVPGKVHITYIVELRNGIPREIKALGGHLKDKAI